MKKRKVEEENVHRCYLGDLSRTHNFFQQGYIRFHYPMYYIVRKIMYTNIIMYSVVYAIDEIRRQLVSTEYATLEEAIASGKRLEAKGYSALDRGDSVKWSYIARNRARAAINLWTLHARRMGIPRDVRLLISKIAFLDSRLWIP